MADLLTTRWCSACAEPTPFEVVAYVDDVDDVGDLGDETEQACTRCGLAVFVGWARTPEVAGSLVTGVVTPAAVAALAA